MVDGMDHCGIKAKLLIQQHKKKNKPRSIVDTTNTLAIYW